MSTNPPPSGGRDRTTTGSSPAQPPPALQPLDEPLPYGAGFTDPGSVGYGVSPKPATTPTGGAEFAQRRRSGSPVLAVAGLLSLGVAVWAILGAPMFTSTVVIAAALVLLVLVGLAMVVRR